MWEASGQGLTTRVRIREDEQRSTPPVVQVAWCTFLAAGLIGTLLGYGVMQETIMSSKDYGGEAFTFSLFLVFCNRISNLVFALVMVCLRGESMLWVAPLWKYAAISLSNVYASDLQYLALLYVSFPVQMLGKSFKMMPVMVWGMLVSGKRYSLRDWTIASLVTGGVTEFLLTGPISKSNEQRTEIKGLLLILGFLGLDGFTSTYQEKLFKEYTISKYNQMLWVNVTSSVVALLTMLTTGELSRALAFVGRHSKVMADATALSCTATASQWFIYSQIEDFGALVFAATMNVRQVASIIMSYIRFHHSITLLQILGLLMVFGALFYKSFSALVPHTEETLPLVNNWLVRRDLMHMGVQVKKPQGTEEPYEVKRPAATA